MSFRFNYILVFLLQTDKSVDMLLRGKSPQVEVILYCSTSSFYLIERFFYYYLFLFVLHDTFFI